MSPSFEPGDGDALRTRLRQLQRDRPHSSLMILSVLSGDSPADLWLNPVGTE